MKQLFAFLTIIALVSCNQKTQSDDELLDLVQLQTLKYFWDFADPTSGLARERSNVTTNYGNEVSTIGGSGFGIMGIIVGVERGFIGREEAVDRMLKITHFLDTIAVRFHGAYPHWINSETGKAFHFSEKDNGGDLVETAFLMEGLLTAHQYYNKDNAKETELRAIIDKLWRTVEWNFYTQGKNQLYWHWSPDFGWEMNHPIRGWDECLITYILSAASPTYSINPEVYHQGWTNTDHFINGKKYYDITLPLGFEYGGPLFFSHYSFLGLDPRGLKDQYADYWEQNVAHTKINRAYCIDNPKKFEGYGENCWGLTASDNYKGYGGQSPTNDNGTITPTAALSAFPYTPEYSMQALKHFYNDLGNNLWGEYGFKDAFNPTENWYADSYLAIDQGPIIVMIENYRSQLLWNLFMSHPDVQNGLKKLGFTSPHINP